jgi:hypothetical protein
MPNPTTTWTEAEQANREAWETQSLGLKTTDQITTPNTEAMTPAAADTAWVRTP